VLFDCHLYNVLVENGRQKKETTGKKGETDTRKYTKKEQSR
jgi:hypothetical protein